MTTTATYTPATPKQMRYVASLAAKRQWEPTHPDADLLEGLAGGAIRGLEKWQASDLIGYLLSQPLTAAAQKRADAPSVTEPGYYLRDDVVYFVKWNRERTGTYAKRMVISNGRGAWQYAPGVGRSIAAEGLTALTIADAARLGHLHGVCIVCGRALTDPESVARGIGPVCAKRVSESHIAISRSAAAQQETQQETPQEARSAQRPRNQFAGIDSLHDLDFERECALSGEIVWRDGEASPEEAEETVAAVERDYAERLTELRGY